MTNCASPTEWGAHQPSTRHVLENRRDRESRIVVTLDEHRVALGVEPLGERVRKRYEKTLVLAEERRHFVERAGRREVEASTSVTIRFLLLRNWSSPIMETGTPRKTCVVSEFSVLITYVQIESDASREATIQKIFESNILLLGFFFPITIPLNQFSNCIQKLIFF